MTRVTLMDGRFLFIGHRGLREREVENTARGFQLAKDAGLDGIEMDVQLSRDKEIIVYHDYYAGRLTGLEGMIYDYDYQYLKEASIEGTEERIPLLSQVIERVRKFLYFIELKTLDDDFNEVNQGLVEKVVSLVKQFPHINEVLISFNINSINTVKRIDRNIKTGFLFDRESIERDKNINEEYLLSLETDYLLPSFDLSEIIHFHAMRNQGKKIIFWNVNDVSEAKRARSIGASGIISDYCLSIRGALR